MKNLLILFFQICSVSLIAQTHVHNLLTENLVNPIGLDLNQPRFSWQLSSENRNTLQTAYELQIMDGAKEIWQTGKVNSDQSVFIEYDGKPLVPGIKYNWKVRIWDNHEKRLQLERNGFFRLLFCKHATGKQNWIETLDLKKK
ncbi:MAG: hypothetical protein R2825_19665 [Saprospiraceae bacterium]